MYALSLLLTSECPLRHVQAHHENCHTPVLNTLNLLSGQDTHMSGKTERRYTVGKNKFRRFQLYAILLSS